MTSLFASIGLCLLLTAAPVSARPQTRAVVQPIYLRVDLGQVPEPLHGVLAQRLRQFDGQPFTYEASSELKRTVFETARQLGWKARVKFAGGKAVVVDVLRPGEPKPKFSTNFPNWIANTELHPLRKVDPIYPTRLKQNGVTGTVALVVQIDKHGHVVSAQPGAGPEALWQPAIDAVRQWTYEPVLQGGEPVELLTHVSVTFR